MYLIGWQRDLLRECVEPNPGPLLGEFLDTFAQKYKANVQGVRSALSKIQEEIEQGPPVLGICFNSYTTVTIN